jgi:hypothetical protein
MARKKNATFVGSPVVDVVRDAPIMSRWFDAAAGDFALVFDKITGENGHSATDTIDHSGNGRGCPMAMPVASQQIERDLKISGTTVTAGYFYIVVVPVFCPVGTQQYVIEVDGTRFENEEPIIAEVRSTAWALTDTEVGNWDTPRGDFTARFFVTLGLGWQYVAIRKWVRRTADDENGYFHAWRMWPHWPQAGEGNGLSVVGSGAAGNLFASRSSLTPAVAAEHHIDTAMTDRDAPLDAWALTRLNRMIGATWEYLTGSPVPGNNTVTCTTTRDHTRASFTAEPLLEMPMTSVALSCMRVDNVTAKSDFVGTIGTGAPTDGPVNWVRYPQTATGTIVITRNELFFPPFVGTAGASDLDARVIILDYNTGSIGGNWQARFVIGAATSAWVTFVKITGTNLYEAVFSSLGFTAAAANQIRLELQNTVGGVIAGQEIIVLGYGMAFDV